MKKLLLSFIALSLLFACTPASNSGDNNDKGGALPEGAVDLGLSVYWASCNLGASTPNEKGNFYAWAETEPTSRSTVKDYKWSVDNNTFSKYCPADQPAYWDGTGDPDNKITLDIEDDAARAALGGKWRIPTIEEWEELVSKCTYTGGKFIGKNGNSISLPIAGGTFEIDAHYGYYWSSNLNTEKPHQALIYMFPVSQKDVCARINGISIRPVMSK